MWTLPEAADPYLYDFMHFTAATWLAEYECTLLYNGVFDMWYWLLFWQHKNEQFLFLLTADLGVYWQSRNRSKKFHCCLSAMLRSQKANILMYKVQKNSKTLKALPTYVSMWLNSIDEKKISQNYTLPEGTDVQREECVCVCQDEWEIGLLFTCAEGPWAIEVLKLKYTVCSTALTVRITDAHHVFIS